MDKFQCIQDKNIYKNLLVSKGTMSEGRNDVIHRQKLVVVSVGMFWVIINDAGNVSDSQTTSCQNYLQFQIQLSIYANLRHVCHNLALVKRLKIPVLE